jgi:hypothetical protein
MMVMILLRNKVSLNIHHGTILQAVNLLKAGGIGVKKVKKDQKRWTAKNEFCLFATKLFTQ